MASLTAWLEAAERYRVREPMAMTLATTGSDGSSRRIELLADEEADRLFAQRPREARATSAVSAQSQPLQDARVMRTQANTLAASGSEIERPADWSGYRLRIERIEFWHGSPDRLHRRLQFTRSGVGWVTLRLQP